MKTMKTFTHDRGGAVFVKTNYEMDGTRASDVLRNLRDLPITEPPRALAIETRSEFRGNRLTHRFYPEHYAKVCLARDIATRYAS